MDSWQPIETAPRDGTQILTWNPTFYRGKGGCACCIWFDGDWREFSLMKLTPTHWMPLPNGPHWTGGIDMADPGSRDYSQVSIHLNTGKH